VVQVITTVAEEETARTLSAEAVVAGLAACAQVEGPIRSTFRWEGRVTDAEEWRVVAKTTAAVAPRLVAHWRMHHTYEVPELLVVPVGGGDPDYLAWVAAEVGLSEG
jgi:periplasmic divalent cation tolerance protein